MITFRCRCSHAFSVEDERAGESFQCPSCGLLVDVPTLEERRAMDEDGSYTLNDIGLPTPDQSGLRSTPSIADRHDRRDRRLTLKEFLAIGTTEEDLLDIKDDVRPGVPKHPKYDPVTGELIVPLEVKRPPVVARPVMAQAPVLGYEVRKRRAPEPTIWMPFREMLALPNLVVCAIVSFLFWLALFVQGSLGSANVVATFIVVVIVTLPVLLMTVAHFANVVDETGPTGNDEMPRPLRSANLYDDLLRPLVQVAFSYAVAYAPIVLFNYYVSQLPWVANLGLVALFHALVPALLLTTITSGAANNLLPHRALSVIGASSWHYWVAVAVGFAATIAFNLAYLFALSSGTNFVRVISRGQVVAGGWTILGVPRSMEMLLAPLVVFVAMYLLHVFCWQLGLLYRLHHERFAWVLQKHDKSVRNDTNAQLQRHNQRQAEERARLARDSLAKRGAVPVATPATPQAGAKVPTAIPVARPADGKR